MININIVGDGPRDAATVPYLMKSLLGVEVAAEFEPWARLNTRGGYPGKVLFAILQARDAEKDGLVALVDTDKAPKRGRLKELQEGREKDRMKRAPFPTALGEAVPHGEAWLLDDPVAVRQSLSLSNDLKIATIRNTNSPKETLTALINQSVRRGENMMEVLAEIAKAVRPNRYQHASETGFRGLEEDLRTEFGPLLKREST